MPTFATAEKQRVSPTRRVSSPTMSRPARSPQQRALVREILRNPALQFKLTIGAPHDAYEQEADRVADDVMRMPETQLQRACACGGGCPKCQPNQERLQTKKVVSSDLGQSAIPRFAHDFSRIPVYSDGGQHAPPSGAQTVLLGEGETIGPEAVIGTEGMNLVGEAESPVDSVGSLQPFDTRAEFPVDFVGPLQPGDTYAVPHDFVGPLQPGVTRSPSFHPTITVVTPGTRTSDCGAFTYKVRWGIPAAARRAAGWIVQRVGIQFDVKNCAGNPVAPKPIDDPAQYPFWEGWEFTAGQNVWVGHAAAGTRHTGDTFSGSDYGAGTKGKITLTGEVKAISGFALPAGMIVRNAAPAWSLAHTRTEPAQFASTLAGASHTLTSEWDCCPSGTVTKATTVTTNP